MPVQPTHPPSQSGHDSTKVASAVGSGRPGAETVAFLMEAQATPSEPATGMPHDRASLVMGKDLLIEALRTLGDRLGEALAGSRSLAGQPIRSPEQGHAQPLAQSDRYTGPDHASVGQQSPADPLAEIHLLLVGGAAGMLTGLLDADRTTTDCDVMLYHPPEAGEVVERLANDLAGEFGLSEHWLNSGGAPWLDAMPADWERRTALVLSHGPLRLHAVGRIDLIALKLVAGRAQDIEDLETLAVTPEECDILRQHLKNWSDDSWPSGVIAGALELLEILASAADRTPAEPAEPESVHTTPHQSHQP